MVQKHRTQDLASDDTSGVRAIRAVEDAFAGLIWICYGFLKTSWCCFAHPFTWHERVTTDNDPRSLLPPITYLAIALLLAKFGYELPDFRGGRPISFLQHFTLESLLKLLLPSVAAVLLAAALASLAAKRLSQSPERRLPFQLWIYGVALQYAVLGIGFVGTVIVVEFLALPSKWLVWYFVPAGAALSWALFAPGLILIGYLRSEWRTNISQGRRRVASVLFPSASAGTFALLCAFNLAASEYDFGKLVYAGANDERTVDCNLGDFSIGNDGAATIVVALSDPEDSLEISRASPAVTYDWRHERYAPAPGRESRSQANAQILTWEADKAPVMVVGANHPSWIQIQFSPSPTNDGSRYLFLDSLQLKTYKPKTIDCENSTPRFIGMH